MCLSITERNVMVITIEKNIPIPKGAKGTPWKYPYDTMEVGDSFAVEAENPHSHAAQANRRYAPKRFKAVKRKDSRRIWRVE